MLPALYCMNPRYFIRLERPDEGNQKGLCVVIVALLQKGSRDLIMNKQTANREDKVSQSICRIGFDIYKVLALSTS